MSKLKKTIVAIFLLLFMYLCFSAIVSNQAYVSIPFYFLNLNEYPLVGEWLPAITFYLAGSVFIVLFILMLFTIFYPKKLSQFKFRETDGVLRISKKAVEGFVAESLIAEKLMKNPNVKATMSQRKIKIKVKGDYQIVSDLFGKTDQWSKTLETQLHELIGPDVKISIKIKFEKPRPENNNRVT
ncbi:hypothetical protein IGL98_003222 [Enterococcus sp. DIV0840]|uniref:alkaline shock response membrane anchor protein AmaP n=1 Tax=unclassified Enterococcus TaxID=2608891 RepID=UPI001A8CBF94|nr:alkaline shock response membrane anchor protein AmaP [Enterococcus sp. DIV0849a]MBO0436135.1 alkaline shock response membrane anchor protein AmaP [Enterococcus sp. DIV0849a]